MLPVVRIRMAGSNGKLLWQGALREKAESTTPLIIIAFSVIVFDNIEISISCSKK